MENRKVLNCITVFTVLINAALVSMLCFSKILYYRRNTETVCSMTSETDCVGTWSAQVRIATFIELFSGISPNAYETFLMGSFLSQIFSQEELTSRLSM